MARCAGPSSLAPSRRHDLTCQERLQKAPDVADGGVDDRRPLPHAPAGETRRRSRRRRSRDSRARNAPEVVRSQKLRLSHAGGRTHSAPNGSWKGIPLTRSATNASTTSPPLFEYAKRSPATTSTVPASTREVVLGRRQFLHGNRHQVVGERVLFLLVEVVTDSRAVERRCSSHAVIDNGRSGPSADRAVVTSSRSPSSIKLTTATL